MKTAKTAFVLIAATLTAGAWGCGGAKSTELVGSDRALLHRSQNCGDLGATLKADAKWKLNKSIDEQIAAINRYGYGGWGPFGYAGGAERGGAMNAGAPSDSGTAGASTPPAAPSPQATDHSDTNVQVAGVDEADIVKTDGRYIFLIHGQSFKVINAWPAASLAEASSIAIEGEPSEMFVADGKVVVYSTVEGAPIFQAAGVPPRNNDYYEYGYYGASDRAVGAPSNPGGYPGAYWMPTPLTKLTVLTLDGATANVASETYFEGSYLDSRRAGTHVRTILEGGAHGPTLDYALVAPGEAYPQSAAEYVTALESMRARNLAIIDASAVTDWLPYSFKKSAGAVSAITTACEDFYVPTAGSTQYGLTQIESTDLADPAAFPRGTAIVGQADTVYATADTIYLAAHAWVEQPIFAQSGTASSGTVSGGTATATPGATSGGTGTRSNTLPANSITLNMTHVHKFELTSDPSFANYVASGTVAGSIKDQFSMDESGGNLRIATTEQRTFMDSEGGFVQDGRPTQVNHVFVLGQDTNWLRKVGDVGDLAPGESIQSVRFLGARGYVVTFRQVDPLFAVDLSNPLKPAVLGELTLPGFSEYMHPLDDGHLLTIGRDASTSGRRQGLKLQIFDVTNAAAPRVTQSFVYTGDEYGSSEAEYDHKAFTYFADRKLLAFPYYSSSSSSGMRSSLEIFSVDQASGFAKLGSIDHSALLQKDPQGYCGGYYGPSVRRGLFLEDFVYSISYGGIVAKKVTELANPGATLALPSPTVTGYPGCAGL